jgi:pimeloyl-ACP methyl ester carboxylesterase
MMLAVIVAVPKQDWGATRGYGDGRIGRIMGTNRWLAHVLGGSLLLGQSIGLGHAGSVADAATPALTPAAAIELASCTLPGVAVARCGVLHVPENPARPNGRQLPIHVAVIPATEGAALPDPIVPLMGGPGEDAIGAAELYAGQFSALRANRDLLLVDQRGTGRSAALHCDLYSAENAAASLRDVFPAAAAARCEHQLAAHADLTQYGYVRFSSDLEQVRRALGYGPLNLYAGSYGTRAAAVYLRAYPKSVRTAYLGSVVPIDVAQPLPMARTAQATLENLLDECAADSACHGAFPNLNIELQQIAARLTSGVRVSIPRGTDTAPLDRGRVAEWFRSQLYRPQSAAMLPWLIHQAYLGNWSPVVEGILSQASHVDSDLSLGLLFAITCNEDVPFLDEKEIQSQTQGTLLGDYRVRQQQAACKPWPKVSLPIGYRRPVRSSVPILFVSGDADGATPLWYKEHAAAGFTERVEIVAHGQGHTEWSECLAQLYRTFVTNGSTHGIMGAACAPVPRPPFKTD